MRSLRSLRSLHFDRSVRLLPAALVVGALLLAGCMGNAVTVSGQGYKTGTESRSLDCGPQAHLAIGVQGAGRMSVSVVDGGGRTVYSEGSLGAGQDGTATTLQGEPGEWTLRVSTGFGFSGQYGITLSC